MPTPDFKAAQQYALQRLEHELDARLCYHAVTHTRDDVVPAVERLAELAGVTDEDLLLLRTAAYYHDIGFIVQRAEHEAVSVQLAAAALPRFGFRDAHITRISRIIMATRLPQSPRHPLEELLADADLDLLGREDFMPQNKVLRAELAAFGTVMSDLEWCENQLHFISSHHYWSHAANNLRNAGKQRNIAALRVLRDQIV